MFFAYFYVNCWIHLVLTAYAVLWMITGIGWITIIKTPLLSCQTQFCLTLLGQVDADREEDDIFTDICAIVEERLFPSETNAVGFE